MGDPFVVEFPDRPAKGKIHIRKTDEDTGEPVAGAKFEICAKEDILTPAGSVRVPAGSKVSTVVTDEKGQGQSDSLYLGTYEIREIEQPLGYVLAAEIYEVEIEYNGQETELVSAEAKITNKPVKVSLKKEGRRYRKRSERSKVRCLGKANAGGRVDLCHGSGRTD